MNISLSRVDLESDVGVDEFIWKVLNSVDPVTNSSDRRASHRRLSFLRTLREQAAHREHMEVRRLRELGFSWVSIATALGVSAQATWERYEASCRMLPSAYSVGSLEGSSLPDEDVTFPP